MILPNFLICGAPKAGTTSLHMYLSEHPEICMSEPKETGFFFENYEKGLHWFSNQYFQHYAGEKAIGEASAGNMLHFQVASRLARDLPKAKVIMVLRNPIDRLFSHYNFDVTVGYIEPNSSFSEMIRNDSDWRNTMIQLGMYADQIKNYLKYFPKDQIKVYFYEDLKERQEWLIKDLYEFIKVDHTFQPNLTKKHNVSVYPSAFYKFAYPLWKPVKQIIGKKLNNVISPLKGKVRDQMFREDKSVLSSVDRSYLENIYKESKRELELLLNKDLSHWK